MRTAVVIVAVLAVLVTVGCFFIGRKHPENAAMDAAEERGGAEFYSEVSDRPGSPGAEADGVPERGSPAPGPSAEALPDPGSATERNATP